MLTVLRIDSGQFVFAQLRHFFQSTTRELGHLTNSFGVTRIRWMAVGIVTVVASLLACGLRDIEGRDSPASIPYLLPYIRIRKDEYHSMESSPRIAWTGMVLS